MMCFSVAYLTDAKDLYLDDSNVNSTHYEVYYQKTQMQSRAKSKGDKSQGKVDKSKGKVDKYKRKSKVLTVETHENVKEGMQQKVDY